MADEALKQKIGGILGARFSGARVEMFDGYLANIHAIVVSADFAGLTDSARQDLIWEALEEALTPGEVVRVSLALAFAPGEPEANRAFADYHG